MNIVEQEEDEAAGRPGGGGRVGKPVRRGVKRRGRVRRAALLQREASQRLKLAVVEYLEIVFAESSHRLAMPVADNHRNHHDIQAAAKLRCIALAAKRRG